MQVLKMYFRKESDGAIGGLTAFADPSKAYSVFGEGGFVETVFEQSLESALSVSVEASEAEYAPLQAEIKAEYGIEIEVLR